MDIKINGIEFSDVDFTDADLVEAYEAGQETYSRKVKETERHRNQYSQYIREVCDAVREWVDASLGDGAAEEVFDNKPYSLTTALIVAGDLVNAFEESVVEIGRVSSELQERAAVTRDKMEAYGGQDKALNRAQRRQQARSSSKHKSGGKYHRTKNPYDPERVRRDEYPAGSSAN